jgi:hypothetical protein
MKKMINRIIVEGLYYEDTLKESDKNYINGKLNILTSVPEPNIPVNVCETKIIAGPRYGNKPDAKVNPNYKEFKHIMEKEKGRNFLKVGKEAIGIQITGSIGANYFVPRGLDIKKENVISSIVNNGNFITLMDNSLIEEPSATFETDIVITQVVPEMTKGTDENPAMETGNYLVKGYIFDFRNTAIEVTYIAKAANDGSMSAADYFSSLEGSLPIFTKVWGYINGIRTHVERKEESAFGKDKVVSFEATKKEYELTGALPVPYEEGLTEEEFKAALQAREQAIAVALERQSDSASSTSATGAIVSNPTAASSIAASFGSLGKGGFIF